MLELLKAWTFDEHLVFHNVLTALPCFLWVKKINTPRGHCLVFENEQTTQLLDSNKYPRKIQSV